MYGSRLRGLNHLAYIYNLCKDFLFLLVWLGAIIMHNLTSISHASTGNTGLLDSKLHILLYPEPSLCIFNILRSPSSQVFHSLPLRLCPSITIFLHFCLCPFQTTLLYPVVCSFSCLTNSRQSLNLSEDSILHCHITHPQHHHHVISLQLCQVLTTTDNNTPGICLEDFTFVVCSENTLEVS